MGILGKSTSSGWDNNAKVIEVVDKGQRQLKDSTELRNCRKK